MRNGGAGCIPLVVSAVTAFGALSAGGGASSLAAGHRGPCGHRGKVTTIAKAYGAEVCVLKDHFGDKYTQLCDHGKKTDLDDGSPSGRVQYASISIGRRRIGWAAAAACEDRCVTFVAQLRRGVPGAHTSYVDDTTPRDRISRLRVSPRGAIAWIGCPVHFTPKEPNPYLGPTCRASSHAHRVYVVPAASASDPIGLNLTETVLDTGTGISAFSLGITATHVIWRRNGKLHSAPIPPPQ
jgi:hypothetical protein